MLEQCSIGSLVSVFSLLPMAAVFRGPLYEGYNQDLINWVWFRTSAEPRHIRNHITRTVRDVIWGYCDAV